MTIPAWLLFLLSVLLAAGLGALMLHYISTRTGTAPPTATGTVASAASTTAATSGAITITPTASGAGGTPSSGPLAQAVHAVEATVEKTAAELGVTLSPDLVSEAETAVSRAAAWMQQQAAKLEQDEATALVSISKRRASLQQASARLAALKAGASTSTAAAAVAGLSATRRGMAAAALTAALSALSGTASATPAGSTAVTDAGPASRA